MKPLKTSVSLVLVGRFKPDDFLPNKLAEGKVIAQKVAQSASLLALMPAQTVQFKLDWAELLVLPDRFQIVSLEAPHIRICDIVLKALGDLVPDSIVLQFGINVDCHYDFGNADARNSLGARLAPPEAWGSWGKTIEVSMKGKETGTPLQGGVMNIQMRQPFVENEISGWRDVVVGPSLEVPNNTGVLFRSNHHHQLASLDPSAPQPEEPLSADKSTTLLLAALSNCFEKSIEDAVSIFEEVIALS